MLSIFPPNLDDWPRGNTGYVTTYMFIEIYSNLKVRYMSTFNLGIQKAQWEILKC